MHSLHKEAGRNLLLALLVAFSARTRLHSEPFKILGARPLGMGGAFVAVAEDSLAQYWNPAGIAQQRKFDVEIPVTGGAAFTGKILKDINTVSDLADRYSKIQDAQKKGAPVDVDQVSALFRTVQTLNGLNQPKKGVLIEAQAGFNLRIMRLSLSVNNLTTVGGTPFVDTTNIGLGASASNNGVSFAGANTAAPGDAELVTARDNAKSAIDTVGYSNIEQLIGSAGLAAGGITNSSELANALVNQAKTSGLTNAQIQDAASKMKESAPAAQNVIKNAASGKSYADNTSNATLRGISLFEVGLGYGHRFFVDDLYWGANLKALIGRVGYFRQEFLKGNTAGSSAFNDFDKNTKESIQPGVDLGLLLDKRRNWRTKLGIVARNLNSPKFDQPAAGAAAGEQKYRVEPQVRAGLAIYPLKRTFWVIASDVDLTRNITPIPGLASQMWGAGTELNLVNSNMFNLALRGGLMTNLAEAGSKPIYTGGVELKLLHWFIDVAGALSSETEEVKSGTSSSQKLPQSAQIGVSVGLDW